MGGKEQQTALSLRQRLVQTTVGIAAAVQVGGCSIEPSPFMPSRSEIPSPTTKEPSWPPYKQPVPSPTEQQRPGVDAPTTPPPYYREPTRVIEADNKEKKQEQTRWIHLTTRWKEISQEQPDPLLRAKQQTQLLLQSLWESSVPELKRAGDTFLKIDEETKHPLAAIELAHGVDRPQVREARYQHIVTVSPSFLDTISPEDAVFEVIGLSGYIRFKDNFSASQATDVLQQQLRDPEGKLLEQQAAFSGEQAQLYAYIKLSQAYNMPLPLETHIRYAQKADDYLAAGLPIAQ